MEQHCTHTIWRDSYVEIFLLRVPFTNFAWTWNMNNVPKHKCKNCQFSGCWCIIEKMLIIIKKSLLGSFAALMLLLCCWHFSSALALYYGLLVNNSTFILINAVGIILWGCYILLYIGVSKSKVSSEVKYLHAGTWNLVNLQTQAATVSTSSINLFSLGGVVMA